MSRSSSFSSDSDSDPLTATARSMFNDSDYNVQADGAPNNPDSEPYGFSDWPAPQVSPLTTEQLNALQEHNANQEPQQFENPQVAPSTFLFGQEALVLDPAADMNFSQGSQLSAVIAPLLEPGLASGSNPQPAPVYKPQSDSQSQRQSSSTPPGANEFPPVWHCNTPDPSIPTTDLERQQWVLRMIDAISNTEDVIDSVTTGFTRHWVTMRAGNLPYYSNEDKELLAWDILTLAEKLHAEGSSALFCFAPTFWEYANKSRILSFKDRMEKIIELLTISKSRCEGLLAGKGMQSVVAYPDEYLRCSIRRKAGRGKGRRPQEENSL